MKIVFFLALSLVLAQTAFADHPDHPVGNFVMTSGQSMGTEFTFTTDHKVSIGQKGQPDYLAGTVALASQRVWAPGQTEYTYEMTFVDPNSTEDATSCKVVFSFLMGGSISMRKVSGTERCPSGGTLEKIMSEDDLKSSRSNENDPNEEEVAPRRTSPAQPRYYSPSEEDDDAGAASVE